MIRVPYKLVQEIVCDERRTTGTLVLAIRNGQLLQQRQNRQTLQKLVLLDYHTNVE
jgi:hypothetical protein